LEIPSISTILVIAIPVIIAITFHEAAHGFVAWRLGDDTAYRMGRVTFNPLKHVDAFGTILLPALLLLMRSPFLFGYAKPVPVDFSRLRRPRRDMVFVAAAGPGINLVLAVISGALLHIVDLFTGDVGSFIAIALKYSIYINVLLAVFNMLPLPPLDGGRVIVGLLPEGAARRVARLEPWGIPILILVLFVAPLVAAQFGVLFTPFRSVVMPVVQFVTEVIATITGTGAIMR